jgi:hypothetical protein
MKIFLLKSISLFMAILLLFVQSQNLSAKNIEINIPGIDESMFELDESVLSIAMYELNRLDNYIAQNEGVTYEDLKLFDSTLIENVSNSSAPMGMTNETEDPLGIPAFLWGCFLGWVGILLVYMITDNDKAQIKKALTGCLVAGGVYVVIGVVYIVLVATFVTTTDYYY